MAATDAIGSAPSTPDPVVLSTSSSTTTAETSSSAPSTRPTSWNRNTIIEVSAAVGGTVILAVATLILVYWAKARRRNKLVRADSIEKPSKSSSSSTSPQANGNYLAICRLLDEALESRDSLVTTPSSKPILSEDGSTSTKGFGGQSSTS